jgi:hypothetical protein
MWGTMHPFGLMFLDFPERTGVAVIPSTWNLPGGRQG